jgi:2-polyprenyl-3-methyl-5-hydroxy-6-metoxy-1,4-benzoquinol methylase
MMAAAAADPNSSVAASELVQAGDIAAFLSAWLTNDLLEGDVHATLDAYYQSAKRSFSGRMRRYYRNQIREAEAFVTESPHCQVLEVGCGLGTESLWLALKGAAMTAIDVRPERIACARARQQVVERQLERQLACTFDCASLFDLDTARSYDLIWMEQTFHHLEPREAVLDRIAGLLVPGGHVVISEANALNPFLQVQLFRRRGLPRVVTFADEQGRTHAYGDERIVSAGTLEGALAKRGFTCLAQRHFRIFPNHPLFDRFGDIEARLEGHAPAPLFTHFNYVGQLAAEA